MNPRLFKSFAAVCMMISFTVYAPLQAFEHHSAHDANPRSDRDEMTENIPAALLTMVDPQEPVTDKVAYLTFDDGPSKSTSRILEILKLNGIKATFFVIGKTSAENQALLHRIVQQGHTLGNHTFSHDYQRIYASVESFVADVDRLNRFLEKTVGVKPDILRYPGGSNNHLSWRAGGRNVMKHITREMSIRGYQHFDWNVSSTDAAAIVQDKEAIIESVKSNSAGKKEVIVLMHDMDVKTTTIEALPEVINNLKRDGYRFDVLRKDSFTYQFMKP